MSNIEILPYSRREDNYNTIFDVVTESGDVGYVVSDNRPASRDNCTEYHPAETSNETSPTATAPNKTSVINPNNRKRAELLLDSIDKIGASNRDLGAAATKEDKQIPGKETASERGAWRSGKASKLAIIACQYCPLAYNCDSDSTREELIKELHKKGQRNKDIARRALKKDDPISCADILKRINKPVRRRRKNS